MVFLLDALAQVLHRHVLLRQLHLDGAALLLQLGQAPALLAQGFFARRRHPLPAPASAPASSAVCALTCSRSCCKPLDLARAIPGSPIPPAPCGRRKTPISLRRCSITWASSRMRCSSDCCCCRKRGAHLLFGGQRHLAFGQAGVGGVALLAQLLQLGGQFGHLRLLRLLARFQFAGLRGQRGALLQCLPVPARPGSGFRRRPCRSSGAARAANSAAH